METILNWLLNLLSVFAEFGNWLVTPLEFLNLSPLMLFSFGGITLIISIHVIKLFI